MPRIFKDALFEAQWLRTAGHSSSGGAEIGECLAAARRIREGNAESWFDAWNDLAERLEAQADASRAQGREASARAAYLRAANYHRAAYGFLIGAPPDPRVRTSYRRQRHCFAAAAALMRPRGEELAIPYGGGRLHGWLLRPTADARARPTVILTSGYDSSAEELYFFSGAAAVARGYTCILFDGPGQGAALIEDGLVFRPDWEVVVAAVVDDAVARPEVDRDRIALIGLSFGGYLAPRAATGEHRLAACIADPGEYSLLEELRSRLPAAIAREVPHGSAAVLHRLDAALRRRMRHLTRGWILRRALWTHGVGTPLDYLRLAADYTLEGRVKRIRCPTLVCRAEDDEIGATAPMLFDRLTCEKTWMLFATAEGAGAHCESGARELFNQRAFDWLDGVLHR